MEFILLSMVIVSVSSGYNGPIYDSLWRNPNRIPNDKTINNGYSIPKSNGITFKPNVQGKPTGFEESSITTRPIISTNPGYFFNPSINRKPTGFEETSIIKRPIISTNPGYLFNPSINRKPTGFEETSIIRRPIISTNPGYFYNPNTNSNPISLPSILINPSIPSVPSSSNKWNQNAADSSNCNCGSRNSGRIVGGKETLRNEYPWMVLIRGRKSICGGSIITPYHVLTAAHCTNGLEPYQIIISVSKHNIQNPNEGEHHSVARIIQHWKYTYDIRYNDISLLVTKNPIKFNRNIGPVCLPYKRFNMEGKTIKVIGWGRTYGTGDRNILHEADLEYIPFEECRELPFMRMLIDTQSCARHEEKDICDGDSGGPMVYLNPDNNRYYQLAVVSQSDTLCKSRVPTINTDVLAFMDWITAAISESKPGMRACTGESNGY